MPGRTMAATHRRPRPRGWRPPTRAFRRLAHDGDRPRSTVSGCRQYAGRHRGCQGRNGAGAGRASPWSGLGRRVACRAGRPAQTLARGVHLRSRQAGTCAGNVDVGADG